MRLCQNVCTTLNSGLLSDCIVNIVPKLRSRITPKNGGNTRTIAWCTRKSSHILGPNSGFIGRYFSFWIQFCSYLFAKIRSWSIGYFWTVSNRKNYHEYCNTFRKILLDPNNTEIKIDLQRIEDSLDIYSIITAREYTKMMVVYDFISLNIRRS